MSAPPVQKKVYYPERDGKPMGESDAHRRELAQIIEMLEQYFADQRDVYISGNLMFYYEEGVPSKVCSPDVFVVRGVPKGLRKIYKLWEERQVPVFVVEISSKKTRKDDLGKKRDLYATLGVREYVLFDPLDEYLEPPLQLFRLAGTQYVPVAGGPDGSFASVELGLSLRKEGSELRLYEAATGRRLLRPAELEDARRAEAEARREAEGELARLREELARLRGEG